MRDEETERRRDGWREERDGKEGIIREREGERHTNTCDSREHNHLALSRRLQVPAPPKKLLDGWTLWRVSRLVERDLKNNACM